MSESSHNSRRVFLCHSSGDKPVVRKFYERLRGDGVEPWLDSKDLIPGQHWDTEIRKAVKASGAVVVFLSHDSVTKTGYVQREIRVALDVADFRPEGTIFIIPARLEACKVPERLEHLHWVDLFEDDGYERLLRAMRVQGLVGDAVVVGAEAPATRPVDLSPRVNPKDGLKYVWVPPGRFRMGCSEGDTECRDNEKPAHEVEITRGLWLSRTPVTQAAYEKVTGKNPSHFKGGDLPVEQVSWDDACEYCTAVGGRLPTEVEWEYAARARSLAARYGELDAVAWHNGNSSGTTQAVGQKAANGFGLYDMLGNVWEWTADWYGPYSVEAVRDPRGALDGPGRVLRGGGWGDGPNGLRASFRGRYVPGNRDSSVGLRCVWE